MTVTKGYKLTEVGVIPEDWEVESLGDITDIDSDNLGISTSPDYEFKYISLEDVNSGFLKGFSEIKFASAPSRARRKLKRRDVLFATVRPNLKSHLLFDSDTSEWVCSTGFSVIRCKQEKSIPEYIFFHLFAGIISNQIDTLLVGSNYPAVNSKDIKSLKFPAPNVPEQEAIALVLSNTDALITSLDKLIAKKRDIKQAAMQQLLTGMQRLEGFSDSSGKFKQTEIGLIPEDWDIKRVGDICDFIVPGRNKPRIFEGDIPWITTPDLEDGRSVSKSRLNLYISKDEAKNVGSKIVPSGSILMSCVGELGIVALTENEIIINQQLHAFIPSSIIDRFFLLNVIKTQKNYIEGLATKTAVPYLNKDNCNSIPILLPSLPEQQAIAKVLSDMDSEISALEQRRDKTKALKQGMMQELLTGRIRLR
jgi:type I restriction enzyme, S subunit